VRRILVAIVVAVLCVPVTILLTIALSPLWSWIEARFGVEAMGHSGPAVWCFGLTYVLCLTAAVLLTRRR
jgi:hypothetical protein